MFKAISLYHWRQFQDIRIEFDDRLTILTGENGTGKTTILNVLGRHFGWNLHLITAPLPLPEDKSKRFFSDAWEMRESDFQMKPGSIRVGTINYEDGQECRLITPGDERARYQLNYQNEQTVLGLHIPSHRPAFAYYQVTSIPTDPKSSTQQYQAYQNVMVQLYQSESSQNPAVTLKQSLVALAVFGHSSEAVEGNNEYKTMFDGFQETLRKLLPKKLGFQKLQIRMPEIVFVTTSGNFPLDAASGGVGALVGIAWQIFMYGQGKDRFVVTMDEPESHLHPSMQRELLPNLFEAFPKAQFIVTTHSPFIATSSPQAKVHALLYDEHRRVVASTLDTSDLSGTANETLREILGVPISVPIWVEDRFNAIVQKYRGVEPSMEQLQSLKNELVASRLDAFLPDAIGQLGRSNAQSR